MSVYASNTTYEEMVDRIAGGRNIALVTHQKPDGDALGSVLAMSRALATRGQSSTIYLMGLLESGLRSIAESTPIQQVENGPPSDDHDLIIVVDTGSWAQLEAIADWLRGRPERIIGFDHHAHGDDVATQRIVDTSAASTTQMLVPLIDLMGIDLTGESGGIAEALFIGLATDTGWFRYSNADADAFALASRLLATGVDKSRLYRTLEEGHRPQRLALVARALTSVQFLRDGVVAVMTLRPDDFSETGGSLADLESLVNAPMSIGTVCVSILLTQVEPGRTKMSFRSKPALSDDEARHIGDVIDVNQLARQFGGGGHVHAAGARTHCSIDETLVRLVEVVERGVDPAKCEQRTASRG